MARIVPFPRAVFLCDSYRRFTNANIDLYGLFTAIRAANGFPHRHRQFSVFAQLSNGFGRVACTVEIRDASNDELVWATAPRELMFPDRQTVVRLAHTIEG